MDHLEKLPLIRKYSSLTCHILSELRHSGEYSDVILRTDDQRLFKVHRAILCCKISDYFMFLQLVVFVKHVVHSFEHYLLTE